MPAIFGDCRAVVNRIIWLFRHAIAKFRVGWYYLLPFFFSLFRDLPCPAQQRPAGPYFVSGWKRLYCLALFAGVAAFLRQHNQREKIMKPFFTQHRNSALLCCLLLLFVAGCGSDPDVAPPPQPGQTQTLRIGLFPEQDIFVQKKRYTPIAEYLSRNTGMKIELKVLRRYGNIVESFRNENLDGAFFGSFAGAVAIKTLKVEPLARPDYALGGSTYFGVIFVRKDSGIKNADDLKGKTFVFVDQTTTAGWLLPLHFFYKQGIMDYQHWFREGYFSGTHEDAIYDVLNGKAHIGAAKNLIFDQLAKSDSRVRDELEILAVSPKVPYNTLAIRKDLAPDLKIKLKHLLLTMHENQKGRDILQAFGAVRFQETSEDDYKPVFHYARDIGLDLSDYGHHNKNR